MPIARATLKMTSVLLVTMRPRARARGLYRLISPEKTSEQSCYTFQLLSEIPLNKAFILWSYENGLAPPCPGFLWLMQIPRCITQSLLLPVTVKKKYGKHSLWNRMHAKPTTTIEKFSIVWVVPRFLQFWKWTCGALGTRREIRLAPFWVRHVFSYFLMSTLTTLTFKQLYWGGNSTKWTAYISG